MVENDGALIDSWHGILTENRMVLTLIKPSVLGIDCTGPAVLVREMV